MGKKRGRKSSFVVFSGEEIKDTINGRDIGLSQNKTTKNYYCNVPVHAGTERQWLGSDLPNAVIRYRAIVDKLRGELTKYVQTQVQLKPQFLQGSVDYCELPTYTLPAKEQEYIDWLKRELQNPRELAKKTGIQEFVDFGAKLLSNKDLALSELLSTYLSKNKKICKKEVDNTTRFFNEFAQEIDCKYLSEITLQSVHQYEDYLNNNSFSPKYIKNKLDKISTIFRYCSGRYENSSLVQVHAWLRGLERPEQVQPYSPKIISYTDFSKLFASSNLQWQLLLTLALNCALYPIDCARLKTSMIDLEQGTLTFRRGKTGKVLAVSSLWARTKALLAEHLKQKKGESEYLFQTQFGTPYTAAGITNTYNQTIRTKAGVDKSVKFSHLRDTFSTLAQDLGFALEQINLVLGHKNKGMQDRYAVRHANDLTKNMCESVEQEFFKQG